MVSVSKPTTKDMAKKKTSITTHCFLGSNTYKFLSYKKHFPSQLKSFFQSFLKNSYVKISFFLSKLSSYRFVSYILCIIILLLLHLPFLTADPDTLVDKNTRGAFTDEGIYSLPSRNFINTGVLSIKDNTTFIRGPIQTLIYIPIIKIFGENLLGLRLLTLIIVMASISALYSLKKVNSIVLLTIPLVFFQFHIFHFSHYAMAEMICISMLIFSLWALIKYFHKNEIKYALIASLFVFLAYSFKIQYIYFAAILPFCVVLIYFPFRFNTNYLKKTLKIFLIFLTFSFTFIILYLVLWYLPNNDFYCFVMNMETSNRIVFDASTIFEIIYATYYNHIGIKESKCFRYFFVIALFVLPFMMRNLSISEKVMLVFVIVWLFLELHKLFMPYYLPVRYMLSAMVAGGFIISFVCYKMLQRKYWNILSLTIITFALLVNSLHYVEALNRRSYDLKNANRLIATQNMENKLIMGGWAPSISWGSNAKTLHVWNNYINFENILKTYNPHVIISEIDEADSKKAFVSQGINLEAISDSVNYISIWKYDLGIYWLTNAKPTNKNQIKITH